MAKVPDRPDPAKRQEAALGQLRGSVLWGMGLFFAMAMAVVAMAVSFGGPVTHRCQCASAWWH